MVPCRGPTESLVTCSVSGVGAAAETPLGYITAVPGFRFAVPGTFLNLKKQKLPIESVVPGASLGCPPGNLERNGWPRNQ